MNYRRLGRAGLRVSELSFGSWVTFHNQLDVDAALEIMRTAYEAGVNFFDNAEIYALGRSETIMGEVLRKAGWRRSSLVISTKVFWGYDGAQGVNEQGLSRKHVREGLHASLKRLQLDYVDLYFCHRPDPETPIEETVRVMTDLVREGKTLYWGTSEWSAGDIMRADAVARQYHLEPPTMEQPHYNMFARDRFEKEYAPLYKELGYGTTVWSPLASGVLTGKYNEGIPAGSRATLKGYEWVKQELITPERIAKVRALMPVAEELGCSMAQLALAWCLRNPNVSTVILGATRVSQLEENLGSAGVVEKLTPEVMERIEAVLGNKPRGEE